jgi:hypothetical protein
VTFDTYWIAAARTAVEQKLLGHVVALVAAAAQHWALVEAAVAVLDTARALVVAAVAVPDTARALVVAAVAVLDTARALVEAAVATAVAAAAIAALLRGKLHSFAFLPQTADMDQMAKPMEAQAS